MRGKLSSKKKSDGQKRITPAYAGKTSVGTHDSQLVFHHPRVCGENSKLSPAKPTKSGSPPRMRGKRLLFAEAYRDVRITPAYAGKTPALRLPAGNNPDHPRVCGENHFRGCMWAVQSGSPPRMRGKLTLSTT